MRSFVLLFVVFGSALFPFAPAKAGQTFADDAQCSKGTVVDGDFVSGCQGTMAGFRDSADPLAYAALRARANGTLYFEARLNGVFFACIFADTYDAQYFASTAGDFAHARFAIGARNGVCDPLANVERGSFYSGY
jgi:hypothetical protein